MATRNSTGQLYDGPLWSTDDGSDFESDSPSDSTGLSSGYESVICEDLDLYDPSIGVALTAKQILALNLRVNEFQAADYEAREEIVIEFLASFKRACPKGVKFNQLGVETLIRQLLYSSIKPVTRKSKPKARSRAAEEGQGIVLTGQHISLLEKWGPKFRAAGTYGREKIVKMVADKIKNSWAGDMEFDKNTVISLVRRHLYGSLKRRLGKSAFETKKWTYLNVVTTMQRKNIHKLALELSKNGRGGSSNYLSKYHKARRRVEESLSARLRQRYKALAKQWTEGKLPQKLQQRMMAKKGPRAIKEFTSSVYKQFGMRVVVLGAFLDQEGDPSITLFDYNENNGGTSFKARHTNWKNCPMMDDFSKWGAESFGTSPTDGSEDEPAKKRESREIQLETNKDDYPILPSLEEMDCRGLMYKKRLIGKFMTDVYAIRVGSEKARVPWMELQRARGDYIKSKYLPEDVMLRQYYHLRQEDVNAILQHWTHRQAAGKVPFLFRKVHKATQKNKHTLEENDADADMGPGEEEDADTDTGLGEEEDADADMGPGEEEDADDDMGPGEEEDADVDMGPGEEEDADADMGQGEEPEEGPLDDEISQARGYGAVQAEDSDDSSAQQAHPGQNLGDAAEDPSRPSPHSPNNDQTDGRRGCGFAGKEPSFNDEMQSAADEGHQTLPDSPRDADEDLQLPPAPSTQAHEFQQSPPPAPRSASPEMQRVGLRRLRKTGGAAAVANEGPRPPSASPSQANAHQKLPPASRSVRGRKNASAPTDSPSCKRQKVNHQLNGASFDMRRSNRDRRPTAKAAEER